MNCDLFKSLARNFVWSGCNLLFTSVYIWSMFTCKGPTLMFMVLSRWTVAIKHNDRLSIMFLDISKVP